MKTLIIKCGALGDVLRTTSILRAIDGEIYWITEETALPILKNNKFIKQIITIDNKEEIEKLKQIEFDLILSLDDEEEPCKLASEFKTKKLTGLYFDKDKITYTEDSAHWNDIGLKSKFGKQKADELKAKNTMTFQEHLFKMIGKQFHNHWYIFPIKPKDIKENIIGIETTTADRWPMKQWQKFNELTPLLEKKGYKIKQFVYRENMADYFNDINECKLVITGDTFAMHIALALRKDVIGLFGPTSAPEIHDYHRMIKITTNMPCKCCYKKECDIKPNCMDQIEVQEVFDAVDKFINSKFAGENPRAGGIVINKKDPKKILLIDVEHNGIAFAKGKAEDCEQIEEAAVREVEEETCLKGLNIIKKLGIFHRKPLVLKDKIFSRPVHMFLMDYDESSDIKQVEPQIKPVWINIENASELFYFNEDREFFDSIKDKLN